MNILICGFMGAGKTTLAESLRGHFDIFDLDFEVAKFLNISHCLLGSWIAQHGLDAFRELEISTLRILLSSREKKRVIALGGGTVEADGFWELREKCHLLFLDTPWETCLERIENDPNRPLLKLGNAGLWQLYQKRLPLYKKADAILEGGIVALDSLVHNLKERR